MKADNHIAGNESLYKNHKLPANATTVSLAQCVTKYPSLSHQEII